MKLKLSLPGWRHVKMALVGLVSLVSIAALVAAYEMSYAEGVMRDASHDLNVGRTKEASAALAALPKHASFSFFVRVGMMRDEELLRLSCEAFIADREYAKAVDACSRAIAVTQNGEVKHQLLFNRAVAYIPLAMAGQMPKGGTLAMKDLKEDFRTGVHSRAAPLAEKLNLVKAGEGKGDPKQGGDAQKRRPGVPMFDESPSNGFDSGAVKGY